MWGSRGHRALCSLCEKPLWSCAVHSLPGHAHQTQGEEPNPVKELWSCERRETAAFWGKDLHEPDGPAHLLPFLLRAPDATLSTSPIMPTVTWALMPSLKWTPRPVTSPGAFWRSEMWLLRQGSASIQVCRVTWEATSWRGEGWGCGAGLTRLSLVHQRPQERMGWCPWGGRMKTLFHPTTHRGLLQRCLSKG